MSCKPIQSRVRLAAVVATLLILYGCEGEQSALRVVGHESEVVARLSWIMFGGAGLVLLLVIALLVYALWRDPHRRAAINGSRFIFAGGVALPIVTLTVLLWYALTATRDLRADNVEPAVDIEVIGHRWWWEVRYLGDTPDRHFTTANELRLPLGAHTRIKVSSADVIHSWWVPSLAGKIDLIPGRENVIVVRPTREGISRGQCAEFCGAQHARMALYLVVSKPQEFETWRTRQSGPAATPSNAVAMAGRDLFLDSACAYCHTIRGTRAGGRLGPDLTHVGSRLSIAAGTLTANRGNLAGWIVHAQQLKPDSLMPSFRTFSGQELRALTTYLEELE